MKSQRLIIEGGNALSGEIKVQGAKNSSLPIIAASLMCKGETVLKNCPCLTDNLCVVQNTYASWMHMPF